MPGHHLVVVPHTHWDREWYRTHESFRYRLVKLLDGLLDLLEGDPAWRHFTLDGQTVVLDDYLEVRPGARERIAKLVGEGRLQVGPWFVLPDEWLVSGEALVRNLRLGLESAARFGGAMPLGYVPDQFGHVGQLPQLFAGFGFEGAVLWRGVGGDVDETLFEWEAPDGTRLVSVHLRRGYFNGAHLPLEAGALAAKLQGEIEALEPHSRVPSLLVMNGSDHLEPQPGLPGALEAATARLPDVTAEIGTLPGFFARARSEAEGELPRHRGEFRSALRAHLLPGCASARLPQKRADFENDRLLVRYLEPLAAWLDVLGGDGDPGVIDLAWRVALENHPHDSICGCSIDAVHEQMDGRFARVAELAGAHLRRVTGELGARVAAGPGDGPGLVVWNPHAAGVTGVEGEVELDLHPVNRTKRAADRTKRAADRTKRAADRTHSARFPALHLRDAAGRRVPVHAELTEAGRDYAEYRLPGRVAAQLVRGFPPEFFGRPVGAARALRGRDGVVAEVILAEEAPPDFVFDEAVDALVQALEAEGEGSVVYRVRQLPRARLRFADSLPGCGLSVYRLARGRAGGEASVSCERREDGGVRIGNETWRIEVAPDGRVAAWHTPSGAHVEDAVRIVSEGDRGDEYNFDPVPGERPVADLSRVRVRALRGSEAEVGVRIDARLRVPAALAPDRATRATRLVNLPISLELRLARGLDRVDLAVQLDNTARDHRLRVHLRAPFRATRFAVESAFEVAERPIAPQPADFGSDRPAEFPVGSVPQRGFATLDDGTSAFSVANRGATEVEAVPEEDATSVAVTLLRAVGWLSRGDLALRPGHAGPPLETPGAQVPGPHRVELSWRLHAAGDPDRTRAAHAFAAPALCFGGGRAGEAPLADGDRLLAIDDPAVVVSAIEPRADGAPLVRLYDASGEARRVRVRWCGPAARRLERVDLAGRSLEDVATPPNDGPVAELSLRPWEIASLRLL